VGITHWDDVEPGRDLGRAAGAVGVSLRHHRLRPGEQAEPAGPNTEETIFVVAGSGRSSQDLRAGDCVVRTVMHDAGPLQAGAEGLTAFSFVTPAQRPPFLDPEPEPERVVNVDGAESDYQGEAGRWVLLARQAGATEAGVNWAHLEPGFAGAPPHCHSADEELFVILEGGGTLELWPSPQVEAEFETHEVRAGHVISRPPSTRISHFFRAGEEGMTFLVYGTRRPNDVCYYPRSNKIFWRGVGLISRLESLDYHDGEPED
jgi:uncharacterized cupin superfamily protein